MDGNLEQGKLTFALYQALCEVHKELINIVESQLPSLDSLFSQMCQLLAKILIEFGVIEKSATRTEATKQAFKFCPHHVSHYLGKLDQYGCILNYYLIYYHA